MNYFLDRGKLTQLGPSAWNVQSSGVNSDPITDGSYTNAYWRTLIAQGVGADVSTHSQMLDAAGLLETGIEPVKYVKFVVTPPASLSSSRQPVATAAAEYYEGLERQLAELEEAANLPDAPVESGAVTSAIMLVKELRRLNYAPPELTWHGGDTVVMLWSFGSTTCAVTVTDGEVGYVIRRDRRRLKIRDSIKIEDFKVLSIG